VLDPRKEEAKDKEACFASGRATTASESAA